VSEVEGGMHTFTAPLELEGKTATGITVPPEIIDALGSGRQPLVHVTLGEGYAYRSRIGVRGGLFKVPVSAEHRTGAGLAAGDEVQVSLALDTEPREVEVPEDLAAALAAEPRARDAFASLSPSRKRQLTASVTDAKTPETRTRRVAKALDLLLAG
jgi:hypothetical protein